MENEADSHNSNASMQEGAEYDVWTPMSAHKLQLIMEQGKRVLELQGEVVSPIQIEKLEKDAKRNWDIFYKKNGNRFFKDRHWLMREFQELIPQGGDTQEPFRLFEVGCGTGSTIFPLLSENPNLFTYACDFSPRAVDLVKQNEMYATGRCEAFVCDITKDHIPIPEGSLDAISLIYVMSAINPDLFPFVMQRLCKLLKPNRGVVLFRDYGICDLSQLRKKGNKLGDNFYARGDGTRTYYFSIEYLSDLMKKCGYEDILNTYCAREVLNRKQNITMHRVWVHGRFRRKHEQVTCENPQSSGAKE